MKIKPKQLALAGLMAALIYVATAIIRIPVPSVSGAYINAGDALIYIAAAMPIGIFAPIVAALGSGLADLTLGAQIYIIPTVIIKAAMALIVSRIYRKNCTGKRFIFGAILGGVVMLLGYFAFESALYGVAVALALLGFNALQFVIGIVVASLLFALLKKHNFDNFS